ncbi:aldehyde dehydrogenase family protein [Bacillus sp. S10(2024)]|uniref:aldehyde dehydrogenase family protein n=1 Tax=Bacillus sp. S10(2024) TaxID=3162886 RepID=UPI003D1D918D
MQSLMLASESPALLDERKENIISCIQYMKINKSEILEILTEISTYQTAEKEFDCSLQALENAIDEVIQNQPPTIDQMSVFMPSNVILYSYILYLIVPSLYVKNIEFRGSSLVINQVRKLHNLFKPVHQLPIELREYSYRKYIRESVLKADVVLFTGTYQNAENIKFQLSRDQLFIFFGQGVNPFILTDSADLKQAVRDLVDVRMFNTGQDCMGPDVVYVPERIKKVFIQLLKSKLSSLKFGDNSDKEADYGSIHYTSTLESIAQYLNQNSHYIIHGGNINYKEKVIEPTVLLSSLKDQIKIDEFFSPIFNIVSYENVEEIKGVFDTGYFLERAMGATVYGEEQNDLITFLQKKHTVSVNQTLFDIEDGNTAFGGYGPMANYISYQGELFIQPILLSQTFNQHWKKRGEKWSK